MSKKEFGIWVQAVAWPFVRVLFFILLIGSFCSCALTTIHSYGNGVVNYKAVEINSLDYAPLQAAYAACGNVQNGDWYRYFGDELHQVTDGTRTVFYTKVRRGVHYEGVTMYVEAMATESGIVMTNQSDFPSQEIAAHYFELANLKRMHYVVVEMEPEPSSQPLTPAQVWCQKWHN